MKVQARIKLAWVENEIKGQERMKSTARQE